MYAYIQLYAYIYMSVHIIVKEKHVFIVLLELIPLSMLIRTRLIRSSSHSGAVMQQFLGKQFIAHAGVQ